MTSADHSDPTTFSVEPYRDSPPDEFIVEELPDLEVQSDDIHDQLPSVEEYKASIAVQPKGVNSMKRNLLILASLSCIILVISLIVKAAKSPSSTQQGQPDLSGRTQEVETFLFNNNISTLPQLQDVGSAQHRAAAFVADGDSLRMPITPETARRFVERYVLALLYYQFNGPRWTYNLKFLSGHDHCDWHETFKNSEGKIVKQGVFCNEDGYVIDLNLCKYGKVMRRFLPPFLPSSSHSNKQPSVFLFYHFLSSQLGIISREALCHTRLDTWLHLKRSTYITMILEDPFLTAFVI